LKLISTIYLSILLISNSYAQKEDNMWIFGYHFYPSFIPAIDFNLGYPHVTGSNSPLEFFGNISSICDSNGYVSFYTDGVTMMNFLHDTLLGSKHFNDDDSIVAQNGYMPQITSQTTFILPYPGHPGQYAVLHHSLHPLDSMPYYQPVQLSMSVVDMTLNNNEGEMILKNQSIINDTLLVGTLQTVKHANGRDWWITIHKWESNIFYMALLTPAGIINVQQIETGPNLIDGLYYNTQRLFSPTGEYFCIARTDSAKVEIFDFDRCNGIISHKKQINLTAYSSTDLLSGCSFSPSGRFLYVSDGNSLYQYDMTSANIANSKKLIANWDGTGGINPYYFMIHQLGPDGKIYIAAPPSDVVHVINNPDLLDTLCQFEQHSLTLLSNYTGRFPVFPNYRLGAVGGSICDSLGLSGINIASSNLPLKLYPNPNNGNFIIEYSLSNNASGAIEITDAAGRLFYAKDLSKYSFIHQINLPTIDEGIYFLKYLNGNFPKYQKFIVVRNN
jgi:hypothetical protein